MGAADVVPGVSGGTMALIVGIYERLIDGIHEAVHGAVSFARGDRAEGVASLRAVPWSLLLPLGAGIVTALAIGVNIIEPLLETYPVETASLFAGLILGALPIPWRRIRRRSAKTYGAAAVAGVAAFVFAGLTASGAGTPSLPMVFGSAAVAICAMILPGVSGAYLLLILGMYVPTLAAVRQLDVPYVATFVAGAAVGLGGFSKLLSWLLDRRHDVTMAALVGLMAGSLRRLWPWQTESGALVAPASGRDVAVAIALVLLGCTAVLALEYIGRRSETRTPADSTGAPATD